MEEVQEVAGTGYIGREISGLKADREMYAEELNRLRCSYSEEIRNGFGEAMLHELRNPEPIILKKPKKGFIDYLMGLFK